MISGELCARLSGKAGRLPAPRGMPGGTRPARGFRPLTVVVSLTALAAAVALVLTIRSLRREDGPAVREQTVAAVLAYEQRQLLPVPMFLSEAGPVPPPSTEAQASPPSGAREPVVPAAAPSEPRPLTTFAGVHAALSGLSRSQVETLASWTPSRNGLYLTNQQRWHCAGHQRFAMDLIATGAVLNKPKQVERGWAAIEAAFARQQPEGHFGDPAVCVALFLGAATTAFDVLEHSQLVEQYRPRIEALRPGVRRAALWLAQPRQVRSLWRGGPDYPNPSFAAAAGLAAVAKREAEPALEAVAMALADHAVGLQRADGAFQHLGSHDSGLQIQLLVQLHWMLRWLSTDRYDQAARRGGEWLFARIARDGELDLTGNTVSCAPGRDAGACHYVSYRDLRWALAFHGTRFDPSALEAIERVFESQAREARRASVGGAD